MKNLSLLGIGIGLIAVSGCAGSGATMPGGGDRANATRTPSLASQPRAELLSSFPARIAGDTELRAADRLAHRMRAELAGTATAVVKICVQPDGKVAAATLARTSGLASFDDLLLDAARDWRYQSFAAPAATRVCQPVSVVYRAR